MILLVAAGIKYWPEIYDYWQVTPAKIELLLEKIQKKGGVDSKDAILQITNSLQAELNSAPFNSSTYLLLGQAYQIFIPKEFYQYIGYFIKEEIEIFSLKKNRLENLEKSQQYLLKGKILTGKDSEKRLFRILLTKNYLLQAGFYLKNSKSLIFSENFGREYNRLSLQEKELLILISIRSGHIKEMEKFINLYKEDLSAEANKTINYLNNNENLLKGLTHFYDNNRLMAINFITRYYKKVYKSHSLKENKFSRLIGVFLGEIYYRNQQLNKSENMALEILNAHPDSFSAYLLLGKIFLSQDKRKKAKDAIQNSLRINPNLHSAKYYQRILYR